MMEKTQRVRAFFDTTDQYLKSNPVIGLRKSIVQELIGNCQGMNIIDIGCGNGELTKEYLDKNKVTFLDISEKMLSLARENIQKDHLKQAAFINSDLSYFTPIHKFDIAVCFGVAAHVDNVSELIRKLNEVTISNGIIILQYTDADKLISRINRFRYNLFKRNKYNYKINFTSSLSIYKILKEEGLVIEKKLHYIPVSPLLSVFTYKTKQKLLFRLYKSKRFSFLNSEIVLYLSKIS